MTPCNSEIASPITLYSEEKPSLSRDLHATGSSLPYGKYLTLANLVDMVLKCKLIVQNMVQLYFINLILVLDLLQVEEPDIGNDLITTLRSDVAGLQYKRDKLISEVRMASH